MTISFSCLRGRFKGSVANLKNDDDNISDPPSTNKRRRKETQSDRPEPQTLPIIKTLQKTLPVDRRPTDEDVSDYSDQFEPSPDSITTLPVQDSRDSDAIRQSFLPQVISARPSRSRHPSGLRQIRNASYDEQIGSSSDESKPSSNTSEIWSDTSGGRDEPTKLSMPAKLDCRVAIYMCEDLLETPESLRISWLAEGQYDVIKRHVQGRLKLHFPHKPRPVVYRTSAKVAISKNIGDDLYEPLETRTVQHSYHWAELIPTLVGRHGSANPFAPLRLDVTWHFDKVNIQGHDGKTLAHKMWNVVDLKLVKNWKGEFFLPRTALDGIFSEEIIRELINNDMKPDPQLNNTNNTDVQTRWKPEWVSVNASALLALCIYAQKPHCLRQLVIDYQMSNEDLPLAGPPPGLSDRDVKPLRDYQKRFLVYNFDKAKLKQKLRQDDTEIVPDWQTVPIIPGRKLGEGGFGIVSEVTIHPDHHNFQEVSSLVYGVSFTADAVRLSLRLKS